jgi:hypothetical protein
LRFEKAQPLPTELRITAGGWTAGSRLRFFPKREGVYTQRHCAKKDVLVQLAAQLTALPRAALLFSGRDTCSALRELSEVLLP